jgi:hypothetical protein
MFKKKMGNERKERKKERKQTYLFSPEPSNTPHFYDLKASAHIPASRSPNLYYFLFRRWTLSSLSNCDAFHFSFPFFSLAE